MTKSFLRIVVTFFFLPTLGHPSLADPVERVLNYYRAECAALIGEDLNIDAALDNIISDPLTVPEDAIYGISLSSEGTTAIVVRAEFVCEGFGASWCGSAGCASYIIVGNKIFGPLFGGRPFTTTFVTPNGNERTLLLVGLSGSACGDASGQRGINSDPCYMSAIWDEDNKTFRANGDLVVLWD